MLNVLFLGNSLMAYNNLPKLFGQIAAAHGKEVNVRTIVKGGGTISDFVDTRTDVGPQTLELLENNHWDLVVIEPSRRISPFEATVAEAELSSAKKMQALAKAAGAEVLLYSVWGNNSGTAVEYDAQSPINMTEVAVHKIDRKSHTKFMHEVNLDFAAKLGGVKVALAGYAFENCIAKYSQLELYDQDRYHPSPIGSYLAAATIYVAVYGEKVENIPYEIDNAPAPGVLEDIANATMLSGLIPDLA